MDKHRRASTARADRSQTANLKRQRSAGKNADRRHVILEAASEAFLAMGYGATSMDEIVRRVGGSKGTIYRYFQSKEDLFAAVVDEIVGKFVQPLPDDADHSKLGLRDTLVLVAVQHATFVLSERHAALMRLVASESIRFPEVGRTYYEHGPARGHARLKLYLEKQCRKGTLKLDDAAEAADCFWGMILHHLLLQRLYHVAGPPPLPELTALCASRVDRFLALYGTDGSASKRRR